MSVGKEWEIPLRQTQKLLSIELFFRRSSTTNTYIENHMHEMGPFLKYGHILC